MIGYSVWMYVYARISMHRLPAQSFRQHIPQHSQIHYLPCLNFQGFISIDRIDRLQKRKLSVTSATQPSSDGIMHK